MAWLLVWSCSWQRVCLRWTSLKWLPPPKKLNVEHLHTAPHWALSAWPQWPLLCPVQPAHAFMVKRGVHVSGASPESISSLLSEVAECGTHYARLSHFSVQPVLDSSCSKGLVFQVRPWPPSCHISS